MSMLPNVIDPFAEAESTPAVSFKDKPIGTTYTLTITKLPEMVQSRDYQSGEPATWPDGNPKMSVVLGVEENGEAKSLWAGKPSSMFTALAEAQKAAGAKFDVGGTLIVRLDGEKPSSKGPKFNAQKLYKAKYTPPAAPPAADPFGGDEPPF